MLYYVITVKIICGILTIYEIVQLINRFVNEMPYLSNDFCKDLTCAFLSHILAVLFPNVSVALDIILLTIRFIRYIIRKFSSR